MAKKARSLVVPGFHFAGLACGIKPKRKKDLALIYSEVPATVVGTFTQHPAAAAPVVLSRRHIRKGIAQAVVINSGNANACTGDRGMKDARVMAKTTAQCLQVTSSRVLVCSTGVIGVPLPIRQVVSGIKQGAGQLKPQALGAAAEAIMTTDKGPKKTGAIDQVGRLPFRLVSFAKGAGMIEPHMKLERPHATLLAFAMTDLCLEPRWAARVLSEAVEASFNCISVDGDTSTNDTCLLLANGKAGNKPLKPGTAGARRFERLLAEQLQYLAKEMVADGEGATKVATIIVKGAKTHSQARQIAYTIANSQLVRTSFYGADPNWGRVLAAAGNSGATCRPDKVDISYGNVRVCRKGLDAGPVAERRAKKVLQAQEFSVTIDCHLGQGTHQLLSSDLGIEYVKLNSCYRS